MNARALLDMVIDGKKDALEAVVLAKGIFEAEEKAYEQLREIAKDQVGTREVVVLGATVSVQKGRAVHSFEHIPTWRTYKGALTDIETTAKRLAKERENAWQKGKAWDPPCDPSTGEVLPVAEVSYAKSSLNIRLPKQ